MLLGFSAESEKNLWLGNFSNLELNIRLPEKNLWLGNFSNLELNIRLPTRKIQN